MAGLIRFAQHYLGLQLKDSDLEQVYKVGESTVGDCEGQIHKHGSQDKVLQISDQARTTVGHLDER